MSVPRVATIFFLLVSSCHSMKFEPWRTLPGKMKKVSAGVKGIYGINLNNDVYRLNGKTWTAIGSGRNNVVVASGVDDVWILKEDGSIRIGDGERDSWTTIPGNQKSLDVSNNGNVWSLNRHGPIWIYRGRGAWGKLDGGGVQVTAGNSGVWHVNSNGKVYYRRYTYNDPNTDGWGWVEVFAPVEMKWLASGTNLLLAVSKKSDLYYRDGMSSGSPTGTRWVKVSGIKLDMVAVQHNLVIGTDSSNNVKYSKIFY
ncbi:lectin L6-like isoform X2 [Bolinopsis microptera]|uniref:lectin L6-like isoform X2 n=1 Tax=Bolinopsis microptera TaxID=2820187 RepID=UPI003078D467